MSSTPQAAVDWSRGVQDAWTRVATFVPELVAFLVVLVVGYLVVRGLSHAAARGLARAGFDRTVERGAVRHALSRSGHGASELAGRVIFYGLMLLVLQVAFGLFGTNPVSTLITDVVRYVPKVLAALVIIVVAAAIASAAKDLVARSLGGLSYGRTLAGLASAAVVTVGVFAALSELEVAPMIVNGLFYAILAVVVGSAVVAIGGGGIQPMRQRWERALDRYDEEKPVVQERWRTSEEALVRGAAASDLTASDTPSDLPSSDTPSDLPSSDTAPRATPITRVTPLPPPRPR